MRFICVHGHFYQPPRENPWLEDVEVQDSAHPHHDWNERITHECYAPNTAARILDDKQRIAQLADNYLQISFNFGPTLLSWMERRAPEIHRRIIEADRASAVARAGHGNALAQVYNHVIMPLASRRDKTTQVVWGIHDFAWRFGRKPEGLWLSETAVDTETLNVLIENGIRFTVLSPNQARRVRPARRSVDRADPGDSRPPADWEDVSGGRVDPSRPYLWRSPAGGVIALFFYDAPISRAVAFEGALNSGETFAARLLSGFSAERDGGQLVNVATDGESYGHHHRFGEMALAYALKKIREDGAATLTNYGEFLSRFPPTWEVDVVEASSWSCPHGVERWRSDCGCRMGTHPHWTQAWRTPLRDSLNDLADSIDRLFEERGGLLFRDPWRARNAYIAVMLDRSPGNLARYWAEHVSRPLSEPEQSEALQLLEMQRHRLLMFTSCAWFFDEISGLESTTVLLSAARALQLAGRFPGGAGCEREFLKGLAAAKSNLMEYGDGAAVYDRLVRPIMADLPRLAAHQALASFKDSHAVSGRVYCYALEMGDRRTERSEGNALASGTIRVRSEITRESFEAAFAVIHQGGPDFQCALKPDIPPEHLEKIHHELADALRRINGSAAPGAASSASGREVSGEWPALLARHFNPQIFTLKDLLLEERRRVLRVVIEEILSRFDETYSVLVEENQKLMVYLQRADAPLPHAFRLALESVLGRDLFRAVGQFNEDEAGAEAIRRVRRATTLFHIRINWSSAAKAFEKRLLEHVYALKLGADPERARRALFLLRLIEELDLPVSLWEVENVYFEIWGNRVKTRPPAERASGVFTDLAAILRFVT